MDLRFLVKILMLAAFSSCEKYGNDMNSAETYLDYSPLTGRVNSLDYLPARPNSLDYSSLEGRDSWYPPLAFGANVNAGRDNDPLSRLLALSAMVRTTLSES